MELPKNDLKVLVEFFDLTLYIRQSELRDPSCP